MRYYLDNVLIDSFTPAQRLVRGAHALALFYPFPDLEGAASHRWSVRLLCAGGGVKIAKGQIRATITGQGMAVGDAWDGTLELEERVGRPTRTPVARKVLAIQDVILAGTQKPIGDAAAEIITRLPRRAPAETFCKTERRNFTMPIHGHTKIELTSQTTGEVETIEKDNIVTNAVSQIFNAFNGMALLREANANGEYGSTSDKSWELPESLYGGILLYDTALGKRHLPLGSGPAGGQLVERAPRCLTTARACSAAALTPPRAKQT